MIDPEGCHLVVWEARHGNGWITLVIEQPDGTVVAWAGLGETIGAITRGDARARSGGRDVRTEAEERSRGVFPWVFRLRDADPDDAGRAARLSGSRPQTIAMMTI